MSEPRCECCELPIMSCGKAAERKARREEADRIKEMLARPDVFPAQYLGTCSQCGSTFHPGDPISRAQNSGYLAGCCL